MLLWIQVFWDVTLCRWLTLNFSSEPNPVIFSSPSVIRPRLFNFSKWRSYLPSKRLQPLTWRHVKQQKTWILFRCISCYFLWGGRGYCHVIICFVRNLVNLPLSYVKPLYPVYRSPAAVVFHSTCIAHRVLSSVIFVTLNCMVTALNGILRGCRHRGLFKNLY